MSKIEFVDIPKVSSLDGVLLGIGNPLLDISAEVPSSFLEKYGVTLNNAILAEDKHLPIYEDMIKDFKVDYVAGGATQNSIRAAQWMLQHSGATGYIGCIGKDHFGQELRKVAESDGLTVHYLEDEKVPTGTCAVLIHEKERSLIANLGAANHYKIDHLKTDAIRKIWEKASFVYSSGFFLTVSPPSLMMLAEYVAANNKVLAINLAAPFINLFFKEPLTQALRYADFVFGNESEAQAFGEGQGFEDKSPQAVALKLAGWEKVNTKRPRIAVITQGADPTIVACQGKVELIPVPALCKSEILDTNGAGDAFVGGFLSQLVQGKDLATCVAAGSYCAQVVLRLSGAATPKTKPTFQ